MSFPANVIPVFGSQRAYADLNFAGGSFGLDGRIVNDVTTLPGWSFTRASLATMFDSTGKLTYGPHNLLLQSQTFGTTWTATSSVVTTDAAVAPDGTTTAEKLVCNNGVTSGRVSQVVTTLVGTKNLLSVYVKPAGWNWFALRVAEDTAPAVYFDISNGVVGNVESGWSNATITSVGNGWYRISAVLTALVASYTWRLIPTNANAAFSTGNGTDGAYIWGAQLEAVTYQTTPSTYYPTTTAAYYGARLVYDPVTLASLGILVEEARTNVCLQSQTFDDASWTKTRATITANATASPDGTSNADAFNEDNTNAASHELIQAIAKAASAITYTNSVYVKKGGRDWICVTNWDGSSNGNRFWFNVNTGVIGSTATFGTPFTSTSYSIQQAPNGFWRCITTFTTNTATNLTTTYYSVSGDGNTAPATALNTVGLYMYGAQLEAGTGASSPIPTTTASVTRAADQPLLTGLSVAGDCTVLFEGLTPNFVSTDARNTLSDGTTNNRLYGLYASGTLSMLQAVGASPQSLASLALAAGLPFKEAATSSAGVFTGAINGGSVTTYTGTPMATLTQLDVGQNAAAGGRYWNQAISRIRIWKSVKPVQALTT